MTDDQQKQQSESAQQAEKQGKEADKQSPTAPPDADPADQEDGRAKPPGDLSEDPAYEPRSGSLKDIKGG